jgi:prepilin peptidase CpaA
MMPWIYFLILAELIVVSWIDIKIKKISNYWFLFNLILSLCLYLFYPLNYPWQWAALIYPVGWILVGFGLYVLGIMGAGDSKFLASLFLIIPLDHQYNMLEKILYSTMVVGVVFLAIKITKDFKKIKAYALSSYWQGLKESIRSSFSFAPVILLAWILFGVEKW